MLSGGIAECACKPAFVYGSESAREIDVRFARWSVQVLFVGCQHELDAMTETDKATALQAIDEVFQKEDLRLLGRTKTRSFRESLVKRINVALKRPAVSDVAFLHASRSGD